MICSWHFEVSAGKIGGNSFKNYYFKNKEMQCAFQDKVFNKSYGDVLFVTMTLAYSIKPFVPEANFIVLQLLEEKATQKLRIDTVVLLMEALGRLVELFQQSREFAHGTPSHPVINQKV